MTSLSSLRLSCAVLLAAGLSGCGGADEGARVPVFQTTGTIKLSGSPVAGAVVTFSPEAEQPVAMGRTDSTGKYSLTTYDANDGAAGGDYKVMVTKSAPSSSTTTVATHDANNPAASSVDMGAAHSAARRTTGTATGGTDGLLPAKYGSKGDTDLRATVAEDGENVFDFDLQP